MQTFLYFLFLLFPLMIQSEPPLHHPANNYIVVHGSTCTLEVYDAHGRLIKAFPVGLGINGMGKTKAGDRKTPIGEYEILWKASRFWESDGGYPIVDGQAFCTPDNQFTTDPQLADPDETLWTDAYGGDQAVVMCLNYPNASDIANGYTGGCIEIHASLYGGMGEYCSLGCVRMDPVDARELYHLVDSGTKVSINK